MTEQAAAPEPFMSGTFALYERPDGSVVVAFRTADGGEGHRGHARRRGSPRGHRVRLPTDAHRQDDRRQVPAPMVKLGLRAARTAARNGDGHPLLLEMAAAAGDGD